MADVENDAITAGSPDIPSDEVRIRIMHEIAPSS